VTAVLPAPTDDADDTVRPKAAPLKKPSASVLALLREPNVAIEVVGKPLEVASGISRLGVACVPPRLLPVGSRITVHGSHALALYRAGRARLVSWPGHELDTAPDNQSALSQPRITRIR
jgi:hypothetical protein